MYWRPTTVMFSDFPFGGSLRLALASVRPLCPPSVTPSGPELGGFWIEESLAKVSTARAIRITAAPTVQPTSRRVFPRICAGTAFLRARNLTSA